MGTNQAFFDAMVNPKPRKRIPGEGNQRRANVMTVSRLRYLLSCLPPALDNAAVALYQTSGGGHGDPGLTHHVLEDIRVGLRRIKPNGYDADKYNPEAAVLFLGTEGQDDDLGAERLPIDGKPACSHVPRCPYIMRRTEYRFDHDLQQKDIGYLRNNYPELANHSDDEIEALWTYFNVEYLSAGWCSPPICMDEWEAMLQRPDEVKKAWEYL